MWVDPVVCRAYSSGKHLEQVARSENFSGRTYSLLHVQGGLQLA